MNDNAEYISYLRRQRERYIEILEGLFGPRDRRFVLGTFSKSSNDEDIPQIHFPNTFHLSGDCIVDIQVSGGAWCKGDRYQGGWQVAHECVHLLDPGKGITNFLEEGLATWFQCEPRYHEETVKGYIVQHGARGLLKDLRNYVEARELVLSCMPVLIEIIKEIRGSGIRLRHITPEILAPALPYVDTNTINRLCLEFEKKY